MAVATSLVKIIAAGLTALTVCSLALGYLVSSFDFYGRFNAFGLTELGQGMLQRALAIGAVIVIFYGAPSLATLAYHDRDTWLALLFLGVAPGLVALPFNFPFGLVALAFGILISAFVRLLCGVGSNCSSKPTC